MAPITAAAAATAVAAAAALTALGYRTTAAEALRNADLSGKVAIVTGGNSGLGLETVRALARAGTDCVLLCRNLEAGQRAAEEVQPGVKGKLLVRQCDLADLASIKACAAGLTAELPTIDLLILNAGVMALRPVAGQPQRTTDGFEMQIGTNHIGHFFLTQLLLPKMKAQGTPGRVVVLSSSAYMFGRLDLDDLSFERRRYRPWEGYNQSKLANLLFASELARRLKEEGSAVKAYSVHPGAAGIIKTNIAGHISANFCTTCFYALAGPFIKTPSQGAATTVYAATAQELEGQSGAHVQDCRVVRPARRGRDSAAAAALWDKTEELVRAALERAGIA